jgi:hypothetical protein
LVVGRKGTSLSPTLIKINIAGISNEASACGALISADNQVLRIRVAGESTPRSLPFSSISNIRVTSTC